MRRSWVRIPGRKNCDPVGSYTLEAPKWYVLPDITVYLGSTLRFVRISFKDWSLVHFSQGGWENCIIRGKTEKRFVECHSHFNYFARWILVRFMRLLHALPAHNQDEGKQQTIKLTSKMRWTKSRDQLSRAFWKKSRVRLKNPSQRSNKNFIPPSHYRCECPCHCSHNKYLDMKGEGTGN